MSKKKEPTPESFPTGKRVSENHAVDGWESARDKAPEKFDQGEADRRAAAYRERHQK